MQHQHFVLLEKLKTTESAQLWVLYTFDLVGKLCKCAKDFDTLANPRILFPRVTLKSSYQDVSRYTSDQSQVFSSTDGGIPEAGF